jgi:uncharacterized RDD family membrane protein YckC
MTSNQNLDNSEFADIAANGQKSNKVYAGFWVRFFSHIVEVFSLAGVTIIIAPTIAIISFLVYWAMEIQIHHSIISFIEFIASGSNMIVNILCFVIFSLYVIFFISSDHQATPGQKIMSIYVGRKNGDKTLLIWSIIRFLMVYLPIITPIIIWMIIDSSEENGLRYMIIAGASLIFLAISLLMTIFTKQKTSLHDVLCGTRVFYG